MCRIAPKRSKPGFLASWWLLLPQAPPVLVEMCGREPRKKIAEIVFPFWGEYQKDQVMTWECLFVGLGEFIKDRNLALKRQCKHTPPSSVPSFELIQSSVAVLIEPHSSLERCFG